MRRTFLIVGAAVLLGGGVVAYLVLHGDSRAEQAEAKAREEMAYVSLVERLPKGKPIPPTRPLDPDARKRWATVDKYASAEQEERALLLKALHEKTQRFFVTSPGAGSGRDLPREAVLDMILMDNLFGGTPDQPGEPPDFPVSAGETLTRVASDTDFHVLHGGGLRFLHPFGFGHIKDRAQVAGFKPHGYRGLLPPDFEVRSLRVAHIQLVGILSNSKPVVYLTDKLPSMEQVRRGKTRALDVFEEEALQSLGDGEDLYVVRKGDTLRMLGALRATKTCQQCHDAEVGDLLGALSYTLRPAPKTGEGEHD